ncbi:MAG: tetratricopeptide repeat protein [Polyangiaceae bacterium]
MNAHSAYSILAALVVTLSFAQARAASSSDNLPNSCVGAEANKNYSECPGGPSKFVIKSKRGAAFKSAPPPREKKSSTETKPKNPGESMAAGQRDTRKTRLKARQRALLITEIQGLERLFKRTPKKSPDRPQLIRRLAEGYVELESAALRDQTGAEIKAQDLKKKNPSAATKARRDASQAKKIVAAARKKAIAYYTLMKNAYPNYSKLDEVLYYLAYEYEQAGDLTNARKVYYELIQKAPKSPYIPNAYLAFGELFFVEAQGDPSKFDLAAAAYKEVVKYPPPDNKVFGYARYKLAYVHWNKGEYAEAMNEFKKVIEFGDQYTQISGAPQLAKSARRDMVPVYAASGAPERAYNFFKPLSGDKGGETKKTIDMLNDLGFAYLDTGHYKEGIALYRDLMGRDKGDRYCHYQSQVTVATQATQSSNKEAIRKELDQQLSVRGDFIKASHSAKSKQECSNKTAELLSETAMAWHLEAVGSGGVRGTGDKKTMDLAAYLYKKVGDNFTAQDFAKFEFPRIVKSDWPTIYKIKYAMADLLYFQERWDECGPAFDAVVAEDPKGESAAEAAFASVLCYQKMYDAMYKGQADRKGKGLGPTGAGGDKDKDKKSEWEKFKPKPFSDTQKGMITAFNRYVCYIQPPKGDKQAEEQYVEVKFARARTYYEAQHWEEAALGFRDVALNHSDHDAGVYAANLYLEALNVLGSKAEPPRPSCFDGMAGDVPKFLKLYCEGKKAEDNKESCELLSRIQFDILRLRAQKLVELADSQAEKNNFKDALDNYRKGGDEYLELWRTYCEGPLGSGEKPKQCENAHEIVYNMARAYQAGRLLAKSIQARLILLNPKYGLEKTDLAQKATYEIGGNYQAIAVYDRAAEFFERYVEQTCKKLRKCGEFADQALSDAVVLRLGLGQDDKAIDDANDFNRYFGARKPDQVAQISFAVAAHYGEKKEWENVRKRLGASLRQIDSKATLDVRLQAHALLGRAYSNMNSRQAGTEYGKVVALWKNPSAAVSEIEKGEGDAGAKQRRLGRALEAVGEATFYFAEQKKAKVDAVKFPVFNGPSTKEAVLKHINEKVKDWIGKKRPLIDDASKEYKKIVDLQPVPPPRWVIAAGSRVGEMWGQFVDEFRAAPIPDSIKKDYELRTAYYGALDDASEPQKQQAKSAFEICLGYSVKYQYWDQYSRACEEWLAKNYKADYHLIDEFRGAPTRVNDPLREQGYPLRLGGEPLPTIAPPKEPEKTPKSEEKK